MRRGTAAEQRAAGSWEPPAGPATRLILVRHGATALTEQGRYSGRGDVPLSERGVRQAEAAAQRVAALAPRVTAVVSSPLVRCTATAGAIATACGAPVRTDEDLIECNFGDWEAHTGDEIRARWPAEYTRWQRSTEVAPPAGESFQQVGERVRRAVRALAEAYPAAAVVVVSHVSPLKLILRDALVADDAMLRRLFLDACGVSIVDVYPDGAVAVRGVNDTSHLLG